MYINICVRIRTYIHMYIYIYVHMYIYIHIYVCISYISKQIICLQMTNYISVCYDRACNNPSYVYTYTDSTNKYLNINCIHSYMYIYIYIYTYTYIYILFQHSAKVLEEDHVYVLKAKNFNRMYTGIYI